MRHGLVMMISAILGGLVGGGLVQVFTAGPPAVASTTPPVLSGQEFRLVTADGQTRAKLFLWEGSRPMLQLSDSHCEARAALTVTEQDGQPSLVFYDDNCRRRMSIDLIPDGLPQLTFRDDGDIPRARLHLLKDGSPILRLFDQDGHPTWTAVSGAVK